jgi:hypothetical protein
VDVDGDSDHSSSVTLKWPFFSMDIQWQCFIAAKFCFYMVLKVCAPGTPSSRKHRIHARCSTLVLMEIRATMLILLWQHKIQTLKVESFYQIMQGELLALKISSVTNTTNFQINHWWLDH